MGKHKQNQQQQQQQKKRKKSSKRGSLKNGCYCCPCQMVSSVFRGVGRCLFVSCYPVVQCFGLDDYRHQHQHHRHFH